MNPVAVVGIANLFPGSSNPEMFWQGLLDKKDSRTQLRLEDVETDLKHFLGKQGEADKLYCTRGGYVRDFKFLANDLQIDAKELEGLDPLFFWGIHVAREALRDAKLLGNQEALKRCGVILANLSFPTRSSNHLFMPIYQKVLQSALGDLAFGDDASLGYFSNKKPHKLAKENMLISAYPAAVIAQSLGLGGVRFALDAACASSCYSVKLACDYLNTGKADVMLSGAISAADPLFVNLGFSIFHAYPADSKSAPLDANSKGLFAGEGAGFFVLKRLQDAQRDGDFIHGVIKGCGLSNDGKGEFVLSPNSKGQVLAYERAFKDANITSDQVQMVECHATGTPKGDRVELASMGQFFSPTNSKPLIGSVKSNVSHLLTAAGMPGMMKAMFSMRDGQIPATINLQQPVQAKDGYFTPQEMPTETASWPDKNPNHVRRVGVSTFGFGGSNAHIVFEQAPSNSVPQTPTTTLDFSQTQKPLPMAIVSMAAHFGECETLQQFSDAVMQGQACFNTLPEKRWRGINRELSVLKEYDLSAVPKGSYIDSFEIDFLRFKIPPKKSDALIPQQMLLLKVADEAVRQAQLQESANVGVLVAMGTELEIHRYRGRVNSVAQVEQLLAEQNITLSDEEFAQLSEISRSSMHDLASINQYTSFIGNIMACRVAAMWDFSGPAFTISAEENSVYQCLEVADNLFKTSDVEAIVIAAVDLSGSAEHVLLRNALAPVSVNPESDHGWFVGEGAGAIVIKPEANLSAQDNAIACIESFAMTSGTGSESLQSSMNQALAFAQKQSHEVVYVEMNACGIQAQDQAEQTAIIKNYAGVVAGSVKNNIGHCFSASGIASLIKLACCASEKKFPKNPQVIHASQQNELAWNENQLAAINSFGLDGRSAHVLMSPMGQIRTLTFEAPKRSLKMDVVLGDEAIQDKILSEENITKFATLKQMVLQKKTQQKTQRSEENNNTMTTTQKQALTLGAYVDWQQLHGRSQTQVAVSNVVSASTHRKLQALQLKEDYTIPEKIIWNTADLVEFAEGDIGKVFGSEFDIIDSYSRRVRLPTTDYLLVTRVTELDATPNEYKPSMMTTEYDIPLDAPYLVDGQIAWSVAVESGQCDLLLISYLGIDFKNKGDRVYRLLDCELTFLTDIAFGGQTLRYEIYIDSFANQGDTTLFFFHYDCFVKDKKVLEMRGGCAGFFTDEELAAGKGVVRTEKEKAERAAIVKKQFTPLLQCNKTQFSREDLLYLIDGDAASCFGANYDQQGLNPSLQFSSEKFLMIDHITNVDVNGGAWGLGLIESYKILEPDHWYFPCHFKDDQVMAGSLMSDGCGQLVMFYMLYLGLQTKVNNARFQPVAGEKQRVRCRGQVLPQSNRLHYRMEVMEVGTQPEPYIKANVEIILDGKVVVDFQNMSVLIKEQDPNHPYARNIEHLASAQTAVSVNALETTSMNLEHPNSPLMRVEEDHSAPSKHGVIPIKHFAAPVIEGQNRVPGKLPFTAFHFFEFATGSIGKCFGEEFSFYDGRIPPRTPCGDLQLVSRVLSVDGVRSQLKQVSSCIAEYDVPSDAWYFSKNSHPAIMPYSVLMEISLQPNGFLSAYMGTTLIVAEKDVFFRNLDGTGELLRRVDLRGKTIVNKSELLSTSVLGSNIIQSFTFELLTDGEAFYRGTAAFGYFSAEALANQLGLDKGATTEPWHVSNNRAAELIDLRDGSHAFFKAPMAKPFYRLAGGQLNFIDSVSIVEGGGEFSKGYIYAERTIDASDWFFQFHFHQDPVMPGSLGVEAIIETMQTYMLKNNLGANLKNPRFAQPLSKVQWKYRGQIIPLNKQMSLDIHVKDIVSETGRVTLIANANLFKDGLRIYEVTDIVLCLEESET